MPVPPPWDLIRKRWYWLIPLSILLGIGTVWLLRLGTRGAEIATVLALLVAVVALILWVIDKLESSDRLKGPGPPVQQNTELKRLIKWIIPLLVLLVLALSPIATSRFWVPPLRVLLGGCEYPTELRVLTSPEQLEPARLLAERYQRSESARRYGCPLAHFYVFALPTSQAREALAEGWPDSALREGPRPDVWLPDSSREVTQVKELAAKRDPAIAEAITEPVPVAWSPIVLGVPASGDKPAAQSWLELAETISSLGWDLVRPDPASSPAGEAATALLYGGGSGAVNPALASDPALARPLEQRIEGSLDRGNYPLGDSLDVLRQYRQAHSPRTAVIVSEQALARYNNGDSLDDPCQRTRNDLMASYPSDTRSLDLQFVRFAWSPQGQADAAIAFGQWLASAEGAQALADAGLRTSEPLPSCLLSSRNGVQPTARFTRDPVPGDTLDAAMKIHQNAQRRTRVLLAVDSSGSMSAPAGAGQGSRFGAARSGVESALELMGNKDEVGLLVFSTSPNTLEVREVVETGEKNDPFGALPRWQAIGAALEEIGPTGDTPLYRAIVDGVTRVGRSDEKSHALVVLTDGRDTTSGLTDRQLIDAVRDKDVRVFVVTLGEISCAAAALREVTKTTGGRCLDADPSAIDIDDKLAEVFGVLWSAA